MPREQPATASRNKPNNPHQSHGDCPTCRHLDYDIHGADCLLDGGCSYEPLPGLATEHETKEPV